MLEDILFVREHFPWFFWLFFFTMGACVGSFLNVCIYRIPKGMSIVHPGSHDLNTGEKIAWHDNIPILSWFLLGGKSRVNKAPISFRYPLVEFLTAALFLVSWLVWGGTSLPHAFAGMVLVAMLMPATFIDLDHMIIPDRFSIGLAGIGVVYSTLFPGLHDITAPGITGHLQGWLESMLGLFVGTAVIYWIGTLAEVALRKPAMGEGDWKFLGGIGAFCGWEGALFSLFGGAFIGTLIALPFLVMARKEETPETAATTEVSGSGDAPVASPTTGGTDGEAAREGSEADEDGLQFGAQIPFGPMLALGCLVYFLFLHGFVETYFSDLAPLFFPDSMSLPPFFGEPPSR